MPTIINDLKFQSQVYVGDVPWQYRPELPTTLPYWPWYVPVQPKVPQCPNCGRCPHCGQPQVQPGRITWTVNTSASS